jgi:hypothetical protein
MTKQEEKDREAEAEIEHIRRIAEYLEFNGFKNLREAAAKGWGDTRPLRVSSDHRSEQEH